MRSVLCAGAALVLFALPASAACCSPRPVALEDPTTEAPQVSKQEAAIVAAIKLYSIGYCDGYYKEKEPKIAEGATQDAYDKWVNDKRTCFAAEVLFFRNQFKKAGALQIPDQK